MKKSLLLLLFILQYNVIVSQAFFVGDTSCNYVKVNSTLYPSIGYPNSYYYIHIDENPDVDIQLCEFYYSLAQFRSLSVTAQNNTEFVYGNGISSICTYSNMIQNVLYSTSLNSSLNWSLTPSASSVTVPYVTTSNMESNTYISDCGEKIDSFYVAFRKILPSTDTIYGWILLDTRLPNKVISYAFKRLSAPIVPVFTNTLTTLCLGDNLSLSANPSYGIFTGPGVENSVFNSTLAGQGIHQVYASDGCTNAATLNITVLQSPNPQFTSVISTVCYGDQVTLQATPSGGVLSGAGITGSTFNSVNANTGQNIISYYVADPNGCSKTATTTIIVEVVKITATNNNTIVCAGSMRALNGVPSGGVFSGSSVTTGGVFSAVNPGLYTAFYTYTNSLGCNSTASLNLSVVSLPVVAFTNTATTCCGWGILPLTAQPPGGVISSTYGISGGTTPGGEIFYAPNYFYGPTVVTYSYYDSYGCNATTTITVQGVYCSGIQEYGNTNSLITVSPNPAYDIFKLAINDYSSDLKFHLTIFSSNGKSIRSSDLYKAENDINISDLATGIYFLEVKSNIGIARKKLIILK